MINSNVVLISLGNKARGGKDYTASYLHGKYPNSAIVHWADKLYEEVENKDREHVLIKSTKMPTMQQDKCIYSILDYVSDSGRGVYKLVDSDMVPQLHEIMTSRGITEYWGQDEKDALMLQFWGTGFRRTFSDKNYWVNEGIKRIGELTKDYDGEEPFVVFIPDTRFINERDAVKFNLGYYWQINRYNEDGSRFIATDRDPNHPSETELDDCPADLIIKATSGDIEDLEYQADAAFNYTLEQWKKENRTAA